MIPANTVFPKFVPDQILTSENLNQLFGYLDEQGRMTRTNLIGTGIVCGLNINSAADGSSITISKGCAVTSEGYLVTVDTKTYMKVKDFDPVKEKYYDKFVDIPAKKKKEVANVPLKLWELVSNTASEADLQNTVPLDNSYLTGKVVMLFAELLEVGNKNCNPDSCDDKGININVNIRPLLVSINDVNAFGLLGSGGAAVTVNAFAVLSELRMPRFDVPNTSPVTTKNIFDAYKTALSSSFLINVQGVLTDAYQKFNVLVSDEYVTNPFDQLGINFAIVHNGSASLNQLKHIQYYYDLFSDLLLAYDEFRKTGLHVLTTCCPNSNLYPRHVLLGEAIKTGDLVSSYRHYFIYSPLYAQENLLAHLKSLFKRMVSLLSGFALPKIKSAPAAGELDTVIRITPSKLGDAALSDKAIPFYYPLEKGNSDVCQNWSFKKTIQGKANYNLSYHAATYDPAPPDFVVNPLEFDLEPYNFLRIEGHIGYPYNDVFTAITNLKTQNRLPFDVIFLKTGFDELAIVDDKDCCIGDLEISYDIVRREWEAIIGQMIEYLDDNRNGAVVLIGRIIFANYYRLLSRSKKYMVDDLPKFVKSYDEFIRVYEKIESDGHKIRNDLTSKLNILKDQKVLAEDVIDHFDEVILSCKKGAFRALIQAYHIRNSNLLSKLFFSSYAKKHPGLQHKAGVPMGGTFVIVYHEKAKVVKPVNTIRNSILTNLVKPVAETRTMLKKNEMLSFIDEIAELKKLGTDESSFRAKINAFTNSAFFAAPVAVDIINSIGDGIVIADFYLPYSCCSDCAPVQFVLPAPIPNLPPVARPGDSVSIELPANSVTLNGTASSDPDGMIKSYLWEQANGPTPSTISDPAKDVTLVSNLAEGEYIFKLTVTDDDGGSDSKTVKITVLPKPNVPPNAVATTDKHTLTLPDNSANLSAANSSDTDGSIVSFAWSLPTGSTGATIDKPTEVNTGVQFAKAGEYKFTLTVTDNQGAKDTAEVTIMVNDRPNEPPLAKAKADKTSVTLNVDNRADVQLDGSESMDTDGTIESYNWFVPIGTSGVIIQNADKKITNVLFTKEGIFVFTLTVVDDNGAIDTDTVSITVNPRPNQVPIAKAKATPAILTLSGSGSAPAFSVLDAGDSVDTDGTIDSYNWSVPAGTAGVVIQNANKKTATAQFTKDGILVFTLTVTDNKGAVDTDAVTITVNPRQNRGPIANAASNPPSVILSPGGLTTVVLTSIGSSDPDGDPLSFNWALLPGTSGAVIKDPGKADTLVTFSQAAIHNFRLTVTDTGTLSAIANVSVQVKNALIPCASLAGIIQQFQALNTVDKPGTFKSFKVVYENYPEILDFYKKMIEKNIAGAKINDQISFFIEETIELQLLKWIQGLKGIIQQNNDLRLLSLAMLNIHARLAYYIACIQEKDINDAELRMRDVLNEIGNLLNEIRNNISNFSDAQKAELKKLLSLSETELNRAKNNDGETIKPKYLDVIQQIIDVLKSMNL